MAVEIAPSLYDQILAGGRHRRRKPVKMNGKRYAVAVDERGRAVVGPEVERTRWRWLSTTKNDNVVGADEPWLEQRQQLDNYLWEGHQRMTFDHSEPPTAPIETVEPTASPTPTDRRERELALHATIRTFALTAMAVAVAVFTVAACARGIVWLVTV